MAIATKDWTWRSMEMRGGEGERGEEKRQERDEKREEGREENFYWLRDNATREL